MVKGVDMGRVKIPEGATDVRAESMGTKGYGLIFSTSQGEVEVFIGPHMEQVVKLVAKINRTIKKRLDAS